MNKSKILTASLVVVLVAAIGMTALFLNEKNSKNELVQEFELEKEDLENQYTHFAKQYDELKLTVSNDSLSVYWNKNNGKRNACWKSCAP